MTELREYFKKTKLDHDKLELLFKKEYKINVRNFFHEPNIYCLEFTPRSNFKNMIVRQCTGIIIEKHTNKILHYFGEKTYKKIKNININDDGYDVIIPEKINFDNVYIRTYIESPIIKLFYHENKWKYITTPYKIKINFWKIIEKNFNHRYDFIQNLDCNYCYSFSINNEKIIFINKTELNSLNVILNYRSEEIKFKYLNLNKYENNDLKFLLLEKNKNREIITKIKVNFDDIKVLKDKICKYGNDCFNRKCNYIHYFTRNIDIVNEKYKNHIIYMKKINPIYKSIECKNKENCIFGDYCNFYHNNDPIDIIT